MKRLKILISVLICLGKAKYTSPQTISDEEKPKDELNICKTEVCVKTANTILSNLNLSADPCDDFYEYACGGWIARTKIPEHRASYSVGSKLDDERAHKIIEFLKDDNTASDPDSVKKARNLFEACKDTDRIEKLGVAPLLELQTKLGGWPMIDPNWKDDGFDLLDTLSKLRLLNNGYLLDIWVSADDKDNTKNILQLDEFYLGLGNRQYYLQPEFAKELAAYKVFIKEVALFLKADPETVDKDVDDVIEFEISMAKIALTDEEANDWPGRYRKYKVGELSTIISDKFPWKTYMNMLFKDVEFTFEDDTEVVVYATDFLRNMSHIVSETPPRVLANYLVWRITEYRISYLPQALIDIENKFYKEAFSIPEQEPRDLKCSDYTNNVLGWAVGRLFVNKMFKTDPKKPLMDMVERMKEAFDKMLKESEWMDDATKILAKEKLAAIGENIGYPDWLFNNTALDERYEGLEFARDEYFLNHLGWIGWLVRREFNKILKPVESDRWSAKPAEINSYYSNEQNLIEVPAGIFQSPYWDAEQPMSLNYGGIGTYLGFPMTSAFDDTGRQFDKDGNLRDWWDQMTIDAFHNQTQCMIDQYSAYHVKEVDKNLNGKTTLGTNIADNGATRIAFKAFSNHEETHGPGQRLPGLEDLSPIKLFFLSAAQVDCEVMKVSSLKSQVATSTHPPEKYRVIGEMSNMFAFSTAFNCPTGSAMNPEKKCRVW